MTQTDTQPEPAEPAEPADAADAGPAAARAKKARQPMAQSTRRLLFIIAGVFVLVGSVTGFYFTSDAFDDRTAVLVAARDIEAGEILSSADVGSDLVVVGAIPHIAWSPETPLLFEGLVAAQPIPAGALVRFDMVIQVETHDVVLEIMVPLDISLATEEVSEGTQVLLVDPGADPVEGDEGRPRRIVRQFEVTDFDGARMRLLVPPEEWAQWEALLADVGGTLMVVTPQAGLDVEETIQRLDAVWHTQWSAAVEEVAAAVAAAQSGPVAGPGELEVIVVLDASLAPSGVAEGDLVLLVDPGVEPLGNDQGRPRKVFDTLELQNYADGQMQMFVGPEAVAVLGVAGRGPRRRSHGAARGRRHRRRRRLRTPQRAVGGSLGQGEGRGGGAEVIAMPRILGWQATARPRSPVLC